MPERRFMKTARALVFGLLLCGAAGPAAAAGRLDGDIREGLVPHKALYDIKMVARHSGSQVLDIKGQMTYEWKPSCEAWITDHHFKLDYDYTDNPPMEVISDFSTYEAFDGKNFNFSSRRQRDGQLYEELRGSSTAAQASYSMPEGVTFDLAPGTLFPMAHTVETLERLKAGDKFFNAVIFDGSDTEGPVEINAFLGKPVNAMAGITPSPELDAALVNTPAWNVRMAFFPLNKPEAGSDYEMSVVIHDNGVISDMLVEYGDFSVTQKLAAVERLEPASCVENARQSPGKTEKGETPGKSRKTKKRGAGIDRGP